MLGKFGRNFMKTANDLRELVRKHLTSGHLELLESDLRLETVQTAAYGVMVMLDQARADDRISIDHAAEAYEQLGYVSSYPDFRESELDDPTT